MNDSLDALLAPVHDKSRRRERELKEARRRHRDSVEYRRLTGACGDFSRFAGSNWRKDAAALCKEKVAVWIESLPIVKGLVGVRRVEGLHLASVEGEVVRALYLQLLRANDVALEADSVAGGLARLVQCGVLRDATEFFRKLRGQVNREPPARRDVGEPKEAGPHPSALMATCQHNAEFTWVSWYGTAYSFGKGQQAGAVRILWQAWEEAGGKPGIPVSQERIGDGVDSAADRFELRSVFKRRGNAHPAWGTMIRSVGKGSYALFPPDSRG